MNALPGSMSTMGSLLNEVIQTNVQGRLNYLNKKMTQEFYGIPMYAYADNLTTKIDIA